jgi:hypothetical protein
MFALPVPAPVVGPITSPPPQHPCQRRSDAAHRRLRPLRMLAIVAGMPNAKLPHTIGHDNDALEACGAKPM